MSQFPQRQTPTSSSSHTPYTGPISDTPTRNGSPYRSVSTSGATPRSSGNLISRENRLKMELGFTEHEEDDNADFGIDVSSESSDEGTENGDSESEAQNYSADKIVDHGISTPKRESTGGQSTRLTRLGQSGCNFGPDSDSSEKKQSKTSSDHSSSLAAIQAKYSRLQFDYSQLQKKLRALQVARRHTDFSMKSHLMMIRQALLPLMTDKDALLNELLNCAENRNTDRLRELKEKVQNEQERSHELKLAVDSQESGLSSNVAYIQKTHPELLDEIGGPSQLPKLPKALNDFLSKCNLHVYLSAAETISLLQLLASMKDEICTEKDEQQRLREELSSMKAEKAVDISNRLSPSHQAADESTEKTGNINTPSTGKQETTTIRQLNDQIAKQKGQIQFLQSILKDNQVTASASEQQNRGKAQAVTDENERLNAELYRVKVELEKATTGLKNKDKEIRKLQKESNSSGESKQDHATQISELKAKCTSVQKQLREEKKKSAQLNELSDKIRALEEELQNEKKKNSSKPTDDRSMEKIQEMKQELDSMSTKLSSERKEHEEALNTEISKRQETEKTLYAEVERLQQENKFLEEKLRTQENLMANSKSEHSDMLADYRTSLTKDLSKEISKLVSQQQYKLEKELEEMQTQLDEIMKVMHRQQRSISLLVPSIRKMQSNFTNKLKLLEEEWKTFAEKEREEWKSKTESLSREKESAHKELQEELKQLRSKAGQLKEARDKQRQLFEETRRAKTQAAERNRKSLSATKDKVRQLKADYNSVKSAVSAIMNEFYANNMKLSKKDQGMSLSLLLQAIHRFLAEYDDIKNRYKEEMKERRRIFDEVMELRGNIRVFCRVRPLLKHEAEQGESNCVTVRDEQTVEVSHIKGKVKYWELDKVFGPEKTNDNVYKEAEGIAISVMDGYNACIFAYGQTGSGKTFTMEGNSESRGVNYRALQSLFSLRDSRSRNNDYEYEIGVSMLEIYNEAIRDMLVPKTKQPPKLNIRESAQGVHVPELSVREVTCLDDVLKVVNEGHRNRTTFATNMNEHSSRSHAMVSIFVKGYNRVSQTNLKGKLHLIDLAGSERVGKSGSTGERLKEAQNINRSLSALGDVIAARVSKKGHTPYRNSQLTYLLKDSLAGNSKTLMFVNISPIYSSCEESYASLNFASRVRTIELGKATKHAESATGTDSPGTASPSSESPTPISGSGSRARAKLSNLKSGG